MALLRVLTYNIRGGLGMDGLRDTTRIASLLAPQEPALICFQEVHQRLPWSGWVNQPARLARSLNMRFVFQKCLGYPWGGYGLGLATRLPIRHIARHRLDSWGEPRGVLEVELDWNAAPLTVFCTHWGLHAEERETQSAQMARWIIPAVHPVIVCGDLNDMPEALSVRHLLQAGHLQDAGAATALATYSSDALRARIDVVFHSEDLTAVRVWTTPSEASDHVPLGVDFVSSERADIGGGRAEKYK